MKYQSKYKSFDASKIVTFPISSRTNKVKLEDIIKPEEVLEQDYQVDVDVLENIKKIAKVVVESNKQGKPVIVFSGAHLIKNGLGLLIADLVKRGLITLFAGNGATSIHDFELALIGQTSEYVPQALKKGQFGMNKMKAWQGSYGVSPFTGIVSPAYFMFDFHVQVNSNGFFRNLYFHCRGACHQH